MDENQNINDAPRPNAADMQIVYPHVNRSFGRVKGRPFTKAQETLMEQYLPKMAIHIPKEGASLKLDEWQQSYEAIWLEIGFGAGEHLVHMAGCHPSVLCLGAEPFLNGVAKCLVAMEEQQRSNIRIHAGDVQFLLDALPDASLGRIDILFPDPWPKKSHHKRRIMNPYTLAKCARTMQPGAPLWLATDHRDYAQWMQEHLERSPHFDAADGSADHPEASFIAAPPKDWTSTRYEEKASKQGLAPIFFKTLRNEVEMG